MYEWIGPEEIFDGYDPCGHSWTAATEHRGIECELILSVYDEEDTLPDLMIYTPDGYESFAYTDEDRDEGVMRAWAEDVWMDFTRQFDYLFDAWTE